MIILVLIIFFLYEICDSFSLKVPIFFYIADWTYVNIQAGQVTRISPRYRGLVYGVSIHKEVKGLKYTIS